MAFSKLVKMIVLKYVNKYLNLKGKVKTKIFGGGRLEITKMELNDKFFNDYDLPFKVYKSRIDKITVKAPLLHLKSKSTEVEIENIYLVINVELD